MRNTRHLTILASVAVIFIIATIFSESTDDDIRGSGSMLYPGLLDKANEVSHIKIQRNAGELTLALNNDMWQVKENNDYPADVAKVRELVLGLGNLTIVEPKTKKPENYSRIGLQDVTEMHSPATRLTVKVGDENVADLIVGNSKTSRTDSNKKSFYIRQTDDAQTWLVDGNLPEQWEAKNWLDVNIFGLDRSRIKHVVVDHHDDGEQVYIHRANASIRDFTLDSLKEGEQVNAPFEVNNIATTFTKMTFDDVVSASKSGAEEKPAYTAKLSTFDGLVITFQPFKKGDMHLVKYTASFDPEAAKAGEGADTKDNAASDSKIDEKTNDASDSESKDKKAKLLTEAEVRAEVEKYNAIWQGWMYQLPEFRIKNIGKKKADLLKTDHGNRPIH